MAVRQDAPGLSPLSPASGPGSPSSAPAARSEPARSSAKSTSGRVTPANDIRAFSA